jgi:SAM-dependent methyltransferase
MNVRESYDAAASGYADNLFAELERKPLDRHLLNRFAEATRGKCVVADLGCGPGQVSRYLFEQGVKVLGIDLSPAMADVARHLTPAIEFRAGDMRNLELDDASLAGIVAFYSIVHFEPRELAAVFAEMRRVLAPDGVALIAFHAGEEVIHLDDLFGAKVSLDFRFHLPATVVAALAEAGLRVTEHVEREPYEGAEHASRRCYLLARRSEA